MSAGLSFVKKNLPNSVIYPEREITHFCDNPKCPYHVLVKTKTGKSKSWTTLQKAMPHVTGIETKSDIDYHNHGYGGVPGLARMEGTINTHTNGWATAYQFKHEVTNVFVAREVHGVKITGRFCSVCAGAIEALTEIAQEAAKPYAQTSPEWNNLSALFIKGGSSGAS